MPSLVHIYLRDTVIDVCESSNPNFIYKMIVITLIIEVEINPILLTLLSISVIYKNYHTIKREISIIT